MTRPATSKYIPVLLFSPVLAVSCSSGSTVSDEHDSRLDFFVADLASDTRDDIIFEDMATKDMDGLSFDSDGDDLSGSDIKEQGGFGWPCTSNEQCDSLFCVPFLESSVCTKVCQEDCPEGWECRIAPNGPDLLFICLPTVGVPCKACSSDSDCTGQGFACHKVGLGDGSGSFCLQKCGSDDTCPQDYECFETEPDLKLCYPATQSCICSPELNNTTRPCEITNPVGTCYGYETCLGANGWTACTAASPSAEDCDNVDNNCNGTVDEGFEFTDWNGLSRKRGESCGTGNCAGGTVICANEVEALCSSSTNKFEEICNGLDDDCDGQIDENVKKTFYLDSDGDGFGSPAGAVLDCTAPQGHVDNSTDCDDSSDSAYPGAPEICNAADDDCSGSEDDAVVNCKPVSCYELAGEYFEDAPEACVAGTCTPTITVSCGLFTCIPATGDGSSCGITCFDDSACVQEAHCDLAASTCVPDLEKGAPCGRSEQCQSGFCTDGVCCTGGCTGLCEVCNLTDHVGTCTPVPWGQDPGNECHGFACTGYYAGWAGDSCYSAADVADSTGSCNGSGACLSAQDLCPSQPKNQAVLTCEPLCQDPNAATCSATVPGNCLNVSGGPITCGLGECKVTTTACLNGLPNSCTPGNGVPETCDNRDEDCDGAVDNNLTGLDTDQPAECETAKFVNDITEGQSESLLAIGTIYPAGDVDFWRFKAFESRDHILHSHGFKLTLRLEMPQGEDCVDYDMYVFGDGGCDLLFQGTVSSCVQEALTYTWGGDVFWNDKGFRVKIVGKDNSQFECEEYRLYARMVEN